ncbi:hypothetical protein ACHAXA_010893 [Cyclostephanos tholiformis]|uniref:AB hydrolase-1 domain-containing protein n=1 Tax=Cyclostephanos tholiformis TaxID=382380 RepID=A0ABD3R7L2_9STRA
MNARTATVISAVVVAAMIRPTTSRRIHRLPRISTRVPSSSQRHVVVAAFRPTTPRPIVGWGGLHHFGAPLARKIDDDGGSSNSRLDNILLRGCGDGMMHPSSSSLSSSSSSSSSSMRQRSGNMMTMATDDGGIDHENGDDDHVAATIPKLNLERGTWMFRGTYPIYYEVASVVDGGDDTRRTSPEANDDAIVPILLLNGFGVGTFHQHRLMRRLLQFVGGGSSSSSSSSSSPAASGCYLIYGVDYLGQGSSWPVDCDDGNSDDERNLGYSADTWLEQLGGFLEDVVVAQSSRDDDGTAGRTRVHLVGNSVGGYLATILARRYPSMVSSLTLLNATPVWGLNLPGWSGRLPPPPLPRFVGRALFDVIRNDDVIDRYLDTAYVHRSAFDGTYPDGFDDDSTTTAGAGAGAGASLGAKIRACTEVSNGGHAAFASILWSPPASEARGTTTVPDDDALPPPTAVDFYRTLGELEVDTLLLFGADDPWCTPAIAKRMHATLQPPSSNNITTTTTTTTSERVDESYPRPHARRYVSLENVGHCPNHEAPTAVARVLSRWIGATSSSTKTNDGEYYDGGRRDVTLVYGDVERVSEPWGVVGMREVPIEESRNPAVFDRIVSSLVG